jgi:cytochrome oxidase assembly protein ShyY1
MNILLVILISAASIAVIVLMAYWQMNVVAERLIGKKHRAAEIIHRTGEVPVSWSKKYVVRIERLKKRGMVQRAGLLSEQAKQYYLKSLSRIVGYLKQTPLIQDEDARTILLEALEKTRIQWEDRRAEDYFR